MKSISGSIAELLGAHGIIPEEDIESCRYGLEVLISSLAEILSILLISVFLKNFFETVLFFAAFIPLRIYAGGYHADTQLKCYLISLLVYALFTLAMYLMPEGVYTAVILAELLFTMIMVLAAAPVLHHNKNISQYERLVYRKISIAVYLVEAVIILTLALLFKNNRYIVSLAFGQFAETLSMLLAIVKNAVIKSE